jgi:hypothetical protein
MRLSATLALILAVAALCAGCGDDSAETSTTPTPGPGSSTATLRSSWEGDPACAHPQGASRWGCSVGSYRCQAVVTDRGWSVDCAKPGRSIAFTIPPRK